MDVRQENHEGARRSVRGSSRVVGWRARDVHARARGAVPEVDRTAGGHRRGRRLVNLTPRTVAVLKGHRKRQLEQRVELAGMYEDQGLIFSSEIGTPLNPENLVKRSFKPLLQRSGLPEVRFHDLRHTCATLLMGRGVHPKLVQELLGHATIALTLDTYSHYLPSMGDRASGAMGDALG